MITTITKAYVRKYSDSGQVTAYVEWIDHKGRTGRTEGGAPGTPCPCCGAKRKATTHMGALFERAERQGIVVERQEW